jgi:hypothetical protein
MILTNKYEVGDIVRNLTDEDYEVMQVVVAYRLRPLTKPLPYSLATPQDELTLVERKCRHTKGYTPTNWGDYVHFTYFPDCGEKL